MKTLYLMRHGETLFNVQHKIQGWCDSPLTEKGIKQAQKARDYFSKKALLLIMPIVLQVKDVVIL